MTATARRPWAALVERALLGEPALGARSNEQPSLYFLGGEPAMERAGRMVDPGAGVTNRLSRRQHVGSSAGEPP